MARAQGHALGRALGGARLRPRREFAPAPCGLFKAGAEAAAAEGHFVHVFVDRKSMSPVPIPEAIRMALQRILAPTP